MPHHPMRGLGDHADPVFANPVQFIDRDESGRVVAVRHEYPIEDDSVFDDGAPLPCAASNDLTVFTILDTGDGSVTSYVLDTTDPLGGVRVFDRFFIGQD